MEDTNDLKKAWNEFIYTMGKGLGIVSLLDWMVQKHRKTPRIIIKDEMAEHFASTDSFKEQRAVVIEAAQELQRRRAAYINPEFEAAFKNIKLIATRYRVMPAGMAREHELLTEITMIAGEMYAEQAKDLYSAITHTYGFYTYLAKLEAFKKLMLKGVTPGYALLFVESCPNTIAIEELTGLYQQLRS